MVAHARLSIQTRPNHFGDGAKAYVALDSTGTGSHEQATAEITLVALLAVAAASRPTSPKWRDAISIVLATAPDDRADALEVLSQRLVAAVEWRIGILRHAEMVRQTMLVDAEVRGIHEPRVKRMAGVLFVPALLIACEALRRKRPGDRAFSQALVRVVCEALAATQQGEIGESNAPGWVAHRLSNDPYSSALAAPRPAQGQVGAEAARPVRPAAPIAGSTRVRIIPSDRQGTNGFAIASLAVSLLLFLGPLGAVVGIVCGHIGLHQIRRDGTAGRRLAIAGLIIGYLALMLYIGWFGEAARQSQLAGTG